MADDRAECASLEIAARMNWDRNRPARIVGVNQNVVTSDYPLDHKAGFEQCPQNLSAVDDRQPSAVHARRPRLCGGFPGAHPME